MVRPEEECFVDVIACGDILFEELNAFVDKWHQRTVYYESCLVCGLDNSFSKGFHERCCGFDRVWRCAFSFDKLDKFHCWDGVEKVQPQDLFRSFRCGCELVDTY